MKIIRPGKNPIKTMRETRRKCECIVEGPEDDPEIQSVYDQRDEDYWCFCPTPKCGEKIYLAVVKDDNK